jgi:hypothetical protein
MSDHNQKHDPDYGRVESSVLSPKPILLFLAVLFVATSFVFFVVKGLDWAFNRLELNEAGQGQPATQVDAGRRLPPEPLLQGAPGQGSTTDKNEPTKLPLEAMETLRKETDDKLKSYGWVDKPGGVVHVSIDRAKNMIADKGLPSLPTSAITEEVQRAETVRKEILNAGSSAGRIIKAPAQSQQPVQQQPAQQQDQKPQQVPPQQH